MKRLINISKYKDVKRMFDNKIPISKIARKYNVSRPAIYTVLRKGYGIILKKGTCKHGDKIGKKFGYLIIKDLIQRGKQFHWQWRAICECKNCGNKEFETSIQSILRGSVTSCGCRRDQYEKITGKNSSQFTGFEEIRGHTWTIFRNRAAKKGMDFSIDIKYAWNLYEKQNKKCALTGLPISFGKWRVETTASLDRIDSSGGYEVGNVQWVHKDANIMKSIFPIKYFISICGLICKNNPKIKYDPKLKGNIMYGNFNKVF